MEEIFRVDLIVHPYFGFHPFIYRSARGQKAGTSYETQGYSGLTNANSERYAKRLGDYWGSVINKAKGKKGQIVVIVQQTNKFLEPIERIRKEEAMEEHSVERRGMNLRKIGESFRRLRHKQGKLLEFAERTLGNRLIVAKDTISGSFYEIQRGLRERGFKINNGARIFGYGEISGSCVKTNLERFGEMFDINEKRCSVVKEGTEELTPKAKKKIVRKTWKPRRIKQRIRITRPKG
ncbi:MAG: hypothetical protein AABW72_04795 [archaeon]